MSWQDHRQGLVPESCLVERRILAERYATLTINRLDLAASVGPRQRNEGLHAIVPYKEAYSPRLVREILDTVPLQPGGLLDPFVGAGTSLLVAAERGLTATGIDVLPFAAFAAATLVNSPGADWKKIDASLKRILDHPYQSRGSFPDFPVRTWAFSSAALAELSALAQAIGRCHRGINRDVLRLALLSVVEEMSQATKDGASLRKRAHGTGRNGRFGAPGSRLRVRTAFVERLQQIRQAVTTQPLASPGTVALTGDARQLGRLVSARSFGGAVFSPPYPNRYDYVGNYQLELGFGFVADRAELRALRKSQLRSHLEAPWPDSRTVKIDALDEFLSALLASPMESGSTGRVFKMVAGYFEDMAQVFDGLVAALQPGSPIAIVVGTQCFNGESLPTDLLLAELAMQRGMTVESIWVARPKGVSVQQRAKGASKSESREVILFLKTPRPSRQLRPRVASSPQLTGKHDGSYSAPPII